MTTYSIREVDMSRNVALAGKTVSTRGMNVTYDEDGYAVKAVNYGHQLFADTSKSIRAASKEAVLAAGSRSGYDGPDEDRTHFSDYEFARAVELRRQVTAGRLSAAEANDELEEIRRTYGYSFGASGNLYATITLPEERPEEVAQARASSVMAQAASVQSAAPLPQGARSETERLRESCQTQLEEEQQHRTMRDELEELRVKGIIRVSAEETVSKALLGLTDEDEDD